LDLDVLAALQQDIGCAAKGVHLRRCVHVQAGAAPVVTEQIGAIGLDATEQGDGARHPGLAFPVGEGVRLHEKV
jgi:hypothetical protein